MSWRDFELGLHVATWGGGWSFVLTPFNWAIWNRTFGKYRGFHFGPIGIS